MFKKKELTRLGDILVSKGLITPEQLDLAIKEQSRRKHLLLSTDPSAQVAPIGEILIELGFIDTLQLKRGLNWQQRLRRASIAMALCAPFMVFSPSAAASTFRPAPITVEAENYSAMSGVVNEATSDVGAGKHVGYIDNANWMTYNNIEIPVTGTYKVTYRISSLNGGGSLVLKNATTDTALDTATIPKTGSWNTWVNVERTMTFSAGTHNLKILAAVGGFNINWFKIESLDGSVVASSSSVATTSSTSSSSSSSVSSNTSASTTFPFVIQAESYSSMFGVAKETTQDIGGGQALGYIDTGDWVSYSKSVFKAPFSGKYKFSYRIASAKSGASLALSDITTNTTIDTVGIPLTGGWQAWQTIEREVYLSEGDHTFNLLAKVGGVNINWIQIEPLVIPPSLTIQAENYVKMSGVVNETTSDIGGGKNVGYIDTGDWMSYDNTVLDVPYTTSYKVTYRVASNKSLVSLQLYDLDTGAVIDTIAVPNTAGWQAWVDFAQTVSLPAGKKRFGIRSLKGAFNLNWIKFEPVNSKGEVISDIKPPVVSSSSSSSSSSQTLTSSSKSSAPSVSTSSWSSSSSSNAQSVAGPVGISWIPPDKRENGDFLDITDLGGYELRYKKATDTEYTYISINDPWKNTYNFEWLEGNYVFQIAAFDKNGVYSPFIDIQRQ